MRTVSDPHALQKYCLQYKNEGKTIGFVPTMGALHDGHLQLIKTARETCDIIVVSIFVNPTQFNNPNDLLQYPRTLEQDAALLAPLNVDILFTPDASTIYSDHYRFSVIEQGHEKELCGKTRPGHFNGVLTVVMKLLNIVQPHKAFFGEKDYQQLQLITDMVQALFLPITIVPCPTLRDSEGLALSSRNQRLDKDGLQKAHLFAQALKTQDDLKQLKTYLEMNNIRVDYLEEKYGRRFAAVFIGDVRLIDNVQI